MKKIKLSVIQNLFIGIIGIITFLMIYQQKGDTHTHILCKQAIAVQYENNECISYQQNRQIEIKYGVSTGSLIWRTSAYSEYWGKVASELHYPFTRNALSLSGRYNFTPHFSAHLSHELGKIYQEVSTDTDWLLSISQDPWMKTKQPFYGQTQLSSIRICYSTLENDNSRPILSVSFGYQIYKLLIRMVDPVTYEIVQYEHVNKTSRVGLDSTYEIEYGGVEFELEGKFCFSPHIYLKGNIGYSPWLTTKANGYWNLRNMDLIQIGMGEGLEGEISLNYSPTSSWKIGLTYRYATFNLKKGSFINKLPGGTTGYGKWNSAQAIDKTIFITGSYEF